MVEIAGAISIAIGVGICFGLGAGFIAAGVLAIAGSYAATIGATE
jgi:hypothetical protein